MRTSLSIVAALVGLAGLAVTSRADLQWEMTSLPASFQYALAEGPDGQLIAIGGGTIHRSFDDGTTWIQTGTLSNVQVRHAAFSSVGALYISDFASGVYRSLDDGANWSTGLVEEGCNGLAVSPLDVLFAGLTYTGNGRVHRSSDGGEHWSSIPLPGSTQSFSTETFAFGDSGEAYAGAIDGFYRSTDHGLTWQRFVAGLLGLHMRTLAVAPDQKLYAQTIYPALVDGVYRSDDRGRTWTRLDVGHPYFAELAVAPSGEVLGVEQAEVFASPNQGLSWSSQSQGIAKNEQLNDILVASSGRVFVGGRRIYRSTQVVVGTPPAEFAALSLAAPSPNPIAGEGRISFSLSRDVDVRLSLYDVGGRRVAVLADGLHSSGRHTARIDARRLSAGIYVCELVADGRRVTRRLVVAH